MSTHSSDLQGPAQGYHRDRRFDRRPLTFPSQTHSLHGSDGYVGDSEPHTEYILTDDLDPPPPYPYPGLSPREDRRSSIPSSLFPQTPEQFGRPQTSGTASQVLRNRTLPMTVPGASNCKSFEAFYFKKGAAYSKAPTASNPDAYRVTFKGTPTPSRAYVAFTSDGDIDGEKSVIYVPTEQGMKKVDCATLGNFCKVGLLNCGNSGYFIGARLRNTLWSRSANFNGSQAVLFGPDNMRGERSEEDFVVDVDE